VRVTTLRELEARAFAESPECSSCGDRDRLEACYLWSDWQSGEVLTVLCAACRDTTRSSFVYFVQAKDDHRGPVKIGYTRNPEQRLQSLQHASAEPLQLLAYFEGDMKNEQELHERFAEHRIRGEWFRWNADLDACIQQHRARFISNAFRPGHHPKRAISRTS
jgi:hypothetical protein